MDTITAFFSFIMPVHGKTIILSLSGWKTSKGEQSSCLHLLNQIVAHLKDRHCVGHVRLDSRCQRPQQFNVNREKQGNSLPLLCEEEADSQASAGMEMTALCSPVLLPLSFRMSLSFRKLDIGIWLHVAPFLILMLPDHVRMVLSNIQYKLRGLY